MSAYMVSNENLSRIAGYIGKMLNASQFKGTSIGSKAIYLPSEVIDTFDKLPGVYDTRRGEYVEENIHKALFDMNRAAIIARYGECLTEYEPFDGKPTDIREETRDEWQCRLFTAIRNLLYQCEEGEVPNGALFKAMQRLSDTLAYKIAVETAERDWGCFWSEWKPKKPGERKSQMRD